MLNTGKSMHETSKAWSMIITNFRLLLGATYGLEKTSLIYKLKANTVKKYTYKRPHSTLKKEISTNNLMAQN